MAVAIRSGLDALQRVDLRQGTLVIQNLLLLVAAVGLVDRRGLAGLMLAQVIASVGTVVITAWALLRELRRQPQPPGQTATPAGSLRRLLAYGVPFQLSTMSGLMLDPLAKLFLGHFADLAAVTWYEMASKLITQVRQVLVNAVESLVPHVAALDETQRRSTLAS